MEIEVGKFLNGVKKRVAEGVSVRFDANGFLAMITISNPTDAEVNAIKSGRFQTKILAVEDIAFMLLKFGDMAWMDAPINPISRGHAPIADGNGFLLTIVLADAADSKALALRAIGLSTRFSQDIADVLPRLVFNINDSLKLQSMYSTPKMVKMAQYTN